MSVVEEVCNRVAILDNGTVVEEGEVQAIFSHPTSKAARRLVYPAGAPQAEVLPGHKLVRVAFGGTRPRTSRWWQALPLSAARSSRSWRRTPAL